MQTFKNQMAALERARWVRLSPLERAYELVERHTPPARWPDAELEAFCAQLHRDWPELATMTDAELGRLCDG